jgi:hypothetical protein
LTLNMRKTHDTKADKAKGASYRGGKSLSNLRGSKKTKKEADGESPLWLLAPWLLE